MKNIIVFGVNFTQARIKMEQILETIEEKPVKIIKNINTYEVYFEDYYYKAMRASECARGHRVNKAYVDFFISMEIVNNIIRPLLVCSTLPENEQIEYY